MKITKIRFDTDHPLSSGLLHELELEVLKTAADFSVESFTLRPHKQRTRGKGRQGYLATIITLDPLSKKDKEEVMSEMLELINENSIGAWFPGF